MKQELLERLKAAWPELDPAAAERVAQFQAAMVEENEIQNLTRLIAPKDFVEGHVLDVKHLLNSGMVEFPAMDLGSGGGVPGLLAALIRPDQWILAESERHKADFLFRMVQKFNLTNVRVVADRGERYLAESSVKSIVARAIGPVDRIYTWIHACSTWNTLVLFKGPGWAVEWEKFQDTRFKKELRIESTHEYSVGDENKQRILVRLQHVPRGT